MINRYTLALILIASLGCTRKPNIPFAEYGAGYQSKPDFAAVEHDHPLTAAVLAELKPADLKEYDQEQIEQIYARLTAGPIPDGLFDGDLFLPRGSSGYARVGEILGGFKGVAMHLEVKKLEAIGRFLWKGKLFNRQTMILRNRIDHVDALTEFFPDKADQIRSLKSEDGGLLLFPAKLYCGQSLLDSRRESVIIDYAFTEEIEPFYRAIPDSLGGREGLMIRDEVRMVRPGFYLGRAYMNGAFALNFTLYHAKIAEAGQAEYASSGKRQEDCWVGTQRLTAGAAQGQ